MHVVDDRGLAEEALQRRQRRLGADLPALAFQAFQQRGLLAADIGSGAEPRLELEAPAGAKHRRRRAARLPGDLDAPRPAWRRRADIRSADRRSPSSRPRRGPRSPCPRSGRRDRPPSACDPRRCRCRPRRRCTRCISGPPGAFSTVFHLMPVGKPAPPRPRRPESFDGIHDGLRFQARRDPQAAEPALRGVVVQRQRIDDPAPGEGQALLALRTSRALPRGRARACAPGFEKSCVEEARHIGRRHRPVAVAHAVDLDLDQRLQPARAARAGADEFEWNIADRRPRPSTALATRSAPTERAAASLGTKTRTAHDSTPFVSWTRASITSRSTRPMSSPSIMAAGDSAQLPRQ